LRGPNLWWHCGRQCIPQFQVLIVFVESKTNLFDESKTMLDELDNNTGIQFICSNLPVTLSPKSS
jgi:hypothetical protein